MDSRSAAFFALMLKEAWQEKEMRDQNDPEIAVNIGDKVRFEGSTHLVTRRGDDGGGFQSTDSHNWFHLPCMDVLSWATLRMTGYRRAPANALVDCMTCMAAEGEADGRRNRNER